MEQHNVAQQPCDDPKSISNNVAAFKPEYFRDAYNFPSDKAKVLQILKTIAVNMNEFPYLPRVSTFTAIRKLEAGTLIWV
jgi:hypothetical protein